MAASRAIEALDEVGYSDLGLSKNPEVGAIDAFGFERASEGLGHGVFVAVGFPAHARDQMRIGKRLAILPERILRAAMGMMN
ncbi:MAG: hypothetical protein JWL90_595 [Chthoniobacteraceae bacterium]|nr:hypothetical protein [Chthoniobacteraceae bacterium]